MIDFKDISKIYQMGSEEIHALQNVNMHIDEHEFVAVLGPSGSGKSTMMNIIGCLDIADEGTYILDGNDVSHMSERQLATVRNRRIGFVFQQFNLLQKLSALENVELPLIYQGIPASERHRMSMEALDIVGLKDRVKHKPNELSGGQQQRVAIARALVTKPAIILADEPTGNLDSKSGKDIMNILVDLNGQGNTIILITHDQLTADKARRIVRLSDGMIVEDIILGEGSGA